MLALPNLSPPVSSDVLPPDHIEKQRRSSQASEVEEVDGEKSSKPSLRDRWRKWMSRGYAGKEEDEPGQEVQTSPLLVPPSISDQLPSMMEQTRLRAIPIQQDSPWFQAPLQTDGKLLSRSQKAAEDSTGVWERTLEHDSLQLLDWYLKNSGIHFSTRGLMLLELMSERSPVKIQKMAKEWELAFRHGRGSEVAKPFEELRERSKWLPVNDFWSEGDISASGSKHGGNLDDFMWELRRAGIKPASRRAMLRDLMSQPTRVLYDQLQHHILEDAGCLPLRSWPTPEEEEIRNKAKALLVQEYNGKDNFGGMPHTSEATFREVWITEGRKGMPELQRTNVLRRMRWSGE